MATLNALNTHKGASSPVLLRMAALAGLVSLAAASAFAQGAPRLVTPSDATGGTLLFEATEPGKYISAPALATDVKIDISGPIARTTVTQRFENTSDGWVEGVYVFPLPDNSAVDTMRMQIGNRFIEGQIEEKQKAREIYETAKAEGRKTALLEQQRPNLFTNSLANIGPGETIVVQIEYQESLASDDNQFRLRFPMVVAPRYNPEPKILVADLDGTTGFSIADPVPDRDHISPPVLHPDLGEINPVSLSVSLKAGFPLGEVESAYHEVSINRSDVRSASLELASGTVPANRDFELSWSPKSGTAPSAALFTETIEGEPYYLLMVTPPTSLSVAAPPPREITFVIDTSGSMGGASIRQARQSLALAISRLKPGDTFNVIEFNSNYTELFDTPKPVSDETVRKALHWVEGLQANGGTEMLGALRAALTEHGTADGRLRQVIFLTDGAIGNEQQLFQTIASGRDDARIFTVGIGSAPNSFFMSRAAEIGQGSFTHIGNVDEVAERMGGLFVKLESPAITDVAADWPEGTKVEAWPSPIPDVYRGETLVIAAHAATDDGMVWVSGTTGDQPWKVGLDLEKAVSRHGISKLWARRKIASLELDRARPGADGEALDSRILQTALAHTLVSRLTSLVAVDVTPSRPESASLASQEMPVNLPAGWDFAKVFGADLPVGNAPTLPMEALRMSQPVDAAPGRPDVSRPGMPLPQTASLSNASILRGLWLVLLAALMFGWRPICRLLGFGKHISGRAA